MAPRTLIRAGIMAGFAALMAVSWSALLLAELGWFRAWPCLMFAAMAAAVVFFIQYRRPVEPDKHRDGAGSHAPAAVAALMALSSLSLTLPPSEWIVGGWDPGVYLHTAATVHRTGGLLIDDPEFKEMTLEEQDVLYRRWGRIPEPFLGMRMLPDGRVTPEFHHLYPSLMAVAWSLGGVRGALLVNPLLNVVFLLFLYLFLARMVGRWQAVAAVLVLMVNPAQIWLAKTTLAELLSQCLLLGGAYCLTAGSFDGRGHRLMYVLAGAAFGLALLTRIDSVILLIPLMMLLVACWRQLPDRAGMVLAVAVMGVLVVHYFIHHNLVAPYYKTGSYLIAKWVRFSLIPLAAWLAWQFIRRFVPGRSLRCIEEGSRIMLAVAFIAWALFAWCVRPLLTEPGLATRVVSKALRVTGQENWMRILANEDAFNMPRLAELFGPLGLALGLLGIVILLLRCKNTIHRAWLYASVAVLIILVGRLYCVPIMMFNTRRFAQAVLPLVAAGIAATLAVIAGAGPLSRAAAAASLARMSALRRCAALALLVLTVALNISSTRLMAATSEWAGMVTWYEQLHPHIPGTAIVYCDQPGFAAPLRFIYGKRAWEMQLRSPDNRQRLAGVMQGKLERGEDVMFLSEGGPVPDDRLAVDEIGSFPFTSSILFGRPRTVPVTLRPRGADFILYRVRAAD